MPLDFRHDVPLDRLNTFGIAARARRFVEVQSVEDLTRLVADPAWSAGPRLVLGGGSNVLFARDYDGLVVRLALSGRRLDGDVIEAAAGENWDAFVRAALAADRPGLENLALIPGTVGAGPIQNIGAYGVELADRFAWLDALDVDRGDVVRMTAADCAFGYRDSVFKGALRDRRVIVRVAFRVPDPWRPVLGYGDVRARLGTDDPTPSRVADVVTAIRREKLPDPAVLGNAGSFFKNPVVDAETFDRIRGLDERAPGYPQPDGRVKLAAGWLVERCGWKGRALPGSAAAVHDRQALVLVNRGGATGADVLALSRAIQADVAARFGIGLEPEPVVV